MLPPPTGNATITMFGRTYVGTPGTPVDMPDQDADIAGANGWTITARQGVGATAQRPANPQRGDKFVDTTLGLEVIFDGANFRNPATGLLGVGLVGAFDFSVAGQSGLLATI